MSELISKTAQRTRFGRQFLTDPGAFPEHLEGEPWGTNTLAIDLAGGPYLFTGLDDTQSQRVHRSFPGLCSDAHPDRSVGATTRFLRSSPDAFKPIPTTPWVYTFDLDPGPDAIRAAGLGFMARLMRGVPTTGAVWTYFEDSDHVLGVFANVFRLVVAFRMPVVGGFMLHSSGVAFEDRVYLFYGVSGAGKSTIARLAVAAGGTLLSDDIHLVFPTDHGVEVEKLPFSGELAQNAVPSGRHQLRGVFELHKGTSVQVLPHTPAEAVAGLMSCSAFVNADTCQADTLLARIHAVVEKVRHGKVVFPKDARFEGILHNIEGLQ